MELPLKGILEDVRVVDLTSGLAGPVATMFLAEAGADVIKVETPEGDRLRGTAGFATWNRSKRSVMLALDRADDLAVLDNLLGQADVLVHSMSRSEASRFGLDADSVRQRFPRVILCTVNDYPPGHPDEDRPGSDILVQARAGLMAEVVSRRQGPTFLRLPLPSWGAAYLACSGILVRLFARERYGSVGAGTYEPPARSTLFSQLDLEACVQAVAGARAESGYPEAAPPVDVHLRGRSLDPAVRDLCRMSSVLGSSGLAGTCATGGRFRTFR